MLIGELAKKAGVTRDTVRFYEQAGLIQSCPRPAGMRTYNEYAPEMVARLRDIRQAQRAGFTLREVKSILDDWKGDASAIPPSEIARLLDAKIEQIEARLHAMEGIRDYLLAKRQRLEVNEG